MILQFKSVKDFHYYISGTKVIALKLNISVYINVKYSRNVYHFLALATLSVSRKVLHLMFKT